MNFWFRASEVAYAIADSGTTIVIADRDHTTVIDQARALPEVDTVREWVWLDEVASFGTSVETDAPAAAIDERDAHIILYTSGTTGFPKGAVMSHRAHILHAMTFALHVGAHSDDVYLNVYPSSTLAGPIAPSCRTTSSARRWSCFATLVRMPSSRQWHATG